MSGEHARPTSAVFRSVTGPEAPPHEARHGRREGFGRRLRRRILAYREIEFLSTRIPGEIVPDPGTDPDVGSVSGSGPSPSPSPSTDPGPAPAPAPAPGQECLLLIHVRKVVGQVRYRLCTTCAEGVITSVDIDARFLSSGLPTRALSHLHSRHPGTTWRSTLTLRTTRDLLRRMRISTTPSDLTCVHARRPRGATTGSAGGAAGTSGSGSVRP